MTEDRRQVRLLNLGIGIGVAATLTWVTAAVCMADRGLSGSNEGSYLLYYRHWSTNPHTISASQYFYGPVFELLNWNVVALRFVHLGTLLLAHGYFGWAFARWLLRRRPRIRSARRAEFAVASVVVAAGGIVYGWLPATPGYNDLTLFGALILLGTLLIDVGRAEQQLRPHPGLAVLSGATALIMLVAKPTSVVYVVTVLGVVILVHRRGRARDTLVQVGLWAAGAGIVVLAVHLLIKPLDVIVPPIIDALDVVATYSHRPSQLVGLYAKQTAQVIGLSVAAFALPGLLLVFGVHRLSRGATRPMRTAVIAAMAINCTLVGLAGGLAGGLSHVGAYTAALVAMLAIALGVGLPLLRERNDMLVIALLVLAPVLQAAGTGNPIWSVAVNGAACWTAVALWVVTASSQPTRFALAVAAVCAGILVTTVVGASGSLHTPRGAALYWSSVEEVPDVRLIRSLRLPRAEAREIRHLRRELAPYINPPGRPMVAYGELAHYVLFLNGRPIGQSWFSTNEDGLQTSDLKTACKHGNPWRDRQPAILTIRPLTSTELAGWQRCGLNVGTDYIAVLTNQGEDQFSVLLPRSEVSQVGASPD